MCALRGSIPTRMHKILLAICCAIRGVHCPWQGSFFNDCGARLGFFTGCAFLILTRVFPCPVYAKEKAQREYMNEMAGDGEMRTTDDYKVPQPYTLSRKP
jgi:hypothetical protein